MTNKTEENKHSFDKIEETLAKGPEHKGLPVSGYKPQNEASIKLVNKNKELEEQILRVLDDLKNDKDVDQRWLAIGRTNLEQAFMAINRAVFKPERVKFPGE